MISLCNTVFGMVATFLMIGVFIVLWIVIPMNYMLNRAIYNHWKMYSRKQPWQYYAWLVGFHGWIPLNILIIAGIYTAVTGQ